MNLNIINSTLFSSEKQMILNALSDRYNIVTLKDIRDETIRTKIINKKKRLDPTRS